MRVSRGPLDLPIVELDVVTRTKCMVSEDGYYLGNRADYTYRVEEEEEDVGAHAVSDDEDAKVGTVEAR